MKVSSVPMSGMRDLLPSEVSLRRTIIEKIRKVYTSYGFSEIETPIIERIELLTAGEGGDNEKLIYEILKRGLEPEDFENATSKDKLIDSGLRYDLTVPLARYYANNHAKLPLPFKSLQIGNVFRAERPQKGRFRQFTQCDIDIIGDGTILAEQELLLATTEALSEIGFEDFIVSINDRRILKGILEFCGYEEDEFDTVLIIVDKLDKISIEEIEKELTSKTKNTEATSKLIDFLYTVKNSDENNANLFSNLPDTIESSVINDLKQIVSVIETQSSVACKIVFDPTLVRGMGYYTGPIFEIKDKNFPSSIAGGGRYDKMIGKYGKEDVPACGFSIGFERIMLLLEELNLDLTENKQKVAVIYEPDKVSDSFVLYFANNARSVNDIVSVQKRRKNMTQQLTDLATNGYTKYCLLNSEGVEAEFKSIA